MGDNERISVWIDGSKTPPATAAVSVFDRGFLYGDAVFETMRVYAGRIFSLDEHLTRLFESARRVLINIPISQVELARELLVAVAEGPPDAYLRLTVTRGSGELGLGPWLAFEPRRVTIVAPLKLPPASFYEDGICVGLLETQRVHSGSGAAGAKVGNYLVAVLAAEKARRMGVDDMLLLDHAGLVVEGSSSNVFWVKDRVLFTPDFESGILGGITRNHVLQLAKELDVPSEFSSPRPETLKAADEVFLTSSIRELVPVREVDGAKIGEGRPGPVYRDLRRAFDALTRGFETST